MILAFVTSILKSQDYNVPFSISGISNHSQIKQLNDSSLISLTSVFYLNNVTNNYDSLEWLIVRYNAKGEMMYYTKFFLPSIFTFSPMEITVSGNKFFLAGYFVNDNTQENTAFLLRFNECLEVEKNKCYKYKNESNAYFNGLFSFSDTSILVTGNYFINSDTMFLTVFSMNHDFEVKWQTTIMGNQSDIVVTDKNIHLWGDGYYPASYNKDFFELKLNHIILNTEGKVQSQFVQNEHIDGANSQGWRIVKPINSKFLIGNEGTKSSGASFNGLKKIKMDGTITKSVQLNDFNNEESCGGLCRINDNRYLAIGLLFIDNQNTICMAYLVDSNLNLIRKKRILPNLNLVSLCTRFGPLPFSDGALLSGQVADNSPGAIPYALIYKIDTFLNVMQKPSLAGYTDSLCKSPLSGQICVLPKADTVWLDDLNLRHNIKLEIDEPVSEKYNIRIFPNPSDGTFKIKFDKTENGSVCIYNNIGQLVIYKKIIDLDEVDLQILDNVSSFYYVEIKTQEYTVIKKLTVSKR